LHQQIKTQLDDSSIGGDQFDNVLVDYFATWINKVHSIDICEDMHAMTILSEAVEQAKVKLSSQPEVTVSIPYFTSSAEGQDPIHLNITISRPEFEELVNDLIIQFRDKCQIILKEASISSNDIGEIIFTGGMTRVPKIQETVYQVFGDHQTATVDPEDAVVIGSAIQAALFVEKQQVMNKDMIPLSIGIECEEGIFTRVIPRHTSDRRNKDMVLYLSVTEGPTVRRQVKKIERNIDSTLPSQARQDSLGKASTSRVPNMPGVLHLIEKDIQQMGLDFSSISHVSYFRSFPL
jgi:molecular chaperone DnaK